MRLASLLRLGERSRSPSATSAAGSSSPSSSCFFGGVDDRFDLFLFAARRAEAVDPFDLLGDAREEDRFGDFFLLGLGRFLVLA